MNHKLPSTLEYSDSPSVPLASTLLEHILKPLHFTYSFCTTGARYSPKTNIYSRSHVTQGTQALCTQQPFWVKKTGFGSVPFCITAHWWSIGTEIIFHRRPSALGTVLQHFQQFWLTCQSWVCSQFGTFLKPNDWHLLFFFEEKQGESETNRG